MHHEWFLMCTFPSTNPVSTGLRQCWVHHLAGGSLSSPTFHDCYKTMLWHFLSHQQGKFHSYVESLCLSLFPATLTHSAVMPSSLPCQILPWSWVATAEQLKFEFLLHHLQNFMIYDERLFNHFSYRIRKVLFALCNSEEEVD